MISCCRWGCLLLDFLLALALHTSRNLWFGPGSQCTGSQRSQRKFGDERPVLGDDVMMFPGAIFSYFFNIVASHLYSLLSICWGSNSKKGGLWIASMNHDILDLSSLHFLIIPRLCQQGSESQYFSKSR